MTTSSLLSSQPVYPTTTSPVLGFVGVGWIGQNRLSAAVSAGAHVAAIADPSPECLMSAKAIAPNALTFSTYEELLRLNLDGIVIATPNAFHAPQTIKALENGFAVFCQKPLGRNVAEVKHIIQTALEYNCLLGVDLSYRYVKGLNQIRDLILRGELGDIFAANLVFHNAYGPDKPWFYNSALAGGGCVMDLGTHLIDIALWCLDTSANEVFSRLFSRGTMHKNRNNFVEDYATIRLDLKNGAIADLACSWKLHAGQHAIIEITFYGTNGGCTLQNINGSFVDFVAKRFSGTTYQTLSEPPDIWQGGAIQHWIKMLSQASAFDCRINSQIQLAEVIDAVYEANLNRTSVIIS